MRTRGTRLPTDSVARRRIGAPRAVAGRTWWGTSAGGRHRPALRSKRLSAQPGKRHYAWFNCNGCGNGGGGSGPALIDGRWKYGGDLIDIVISIRDGRA